MHSIQDRIIALAVIASTLGLGFILLAGVADYEVEGKTRKITIDFDRIDNVKPHVTEIKMAGLPVGKVSEVRILARQERAGLREAMLARDPSATNAPAPAIRVIGEIEPDLVLSSETIASIRQASLMSEHYIELTPGAPDSEPMPPGTIIAGTSGKGMDDLMDPGAALLVNLKDAAANVKSITTDVGKELPKITEKLNGVLADAKSLTSGLGTKVPGTIDKADAAVDKLGKALDDVKALTGDLSSQENRDKLRATIENARSLTGDLKVVAQNLKVVSTHAKLITGTLGQRPWRILFGNDGAVNELPDEKRIISSDKPIPVKPAEQKR
ncbi:MAG: MCE family protein [Verrucomicrobiae bacterium]|nr:MCE family protein [Verrucomicrobiae bacterium]